ncbi:MAG: hypothetical protein JNN30_19665 [Rhodanobacteraceae bacterium]|nr:hypothetical protein [Rhodanobacteraceae bacterium]
MKPKFLLISLLLSCGVASAGEVFEDDFSDDQSGWPNTQVADHNAIGIALYNGSGEYQMTPLDDATYGVLPAPRQAKGGDVTVNAKVFLTTGVGVGAAGVVCRQKGNDNFYAFLVTGNHTWAISKMQAGTATTLARGKFDGAMPNIADVEITGNCQGSSLRMELDGSEVGRASDEAFAMGESGLIVLGEKTAGTSAVFDHFRLSDN